MGAVGQVGDCLHAPHADSCGSKEEREAPFERRTSLDVNANWKVESEQERKRMRKLLFVAQLDCN